MSSRRNLHLLLAAGLALATAAVYAQVRDFGFVNYDDPSYIVDNAIVRDGWSRQGLAWALRSRFHGHWHPLTWLSHMTDVELFGLDPGWHHLSSVALHVATTLLLFAFLLRATAATGRSALVAGLFALHPLHVETVAWLADRKDLLAGFFWTLALAAYARYCAAPGWLRYSAVVLAFVAGLMAKSMVITLPAVLLLLDFWPLRRWPAAPRAGAHRAQRLALARILGEKAVLLGVAVFVGGAAVESMVSEFGEEDDSGAALFRRRSIQEAVVSYALYLGKALVPLGLASPYPKLQSSLWQSLAALLLLVAITLPIALYRRRLPHLFTGWCWFLVALLPVVGLLERGPNTLADRYTYIPLTGLLIALVWGAADLAARLRWRRAVPAGLAAATVLGCAVLSALQVRHWRDSETLFSHAVAVTSRNHTAHVGLAGGLLEKGRVEDAIRQLEEALRIEPSDVVALNSLGMIHRELGRFDAALVDLKRAFELEPRLPGLADALADTHEKLGNLKEAQRYYEVALWLEPSADKHYTLGRLAGLRGDAERAQSHYREALRIDPRHELALRGLLGEPAAHAADRSGRERLP